MNSEFDVLQDFPSNGKVYLNNASVSLMPLSSIQAMTEFLTTYSKIGPDSLESEILIKEKLIQIRKAIADVIKCQPDEIKWVNEQGIKSIITMTENALLFE